MGVGAALRYCMSPYKWPLHGRSPFYHDFLFLMFSSGTEGEGEGERVGQG